MMTEKAALASQAEPECGPSLGTVGACRFVAKGGDYATPWRSVPKDGIVVAMHKLSEKECRLLGEGYSLQIRWRSANGQSTE